MTNPTNRPGLDLKEFSAIALMPQQEVEALLSEPHSSESGWTAREEFFDTMPWQRLNYADLLILESARQLVDGDLPLKSALKLITYANGPLAFLDFGSIAHSPSRRIDHDFWIACLASRITQTASRSMPSNAFGENEYSATAWARGTFMDITGEMSRMMVRDNEHSPEFDHCRLFMTNISTADRRLRERINKLGPEIGVSLLEGRNIVGP